MNMAAETSRAVRPRVDGRPAGEIATPIALPFPAIETPALDSSRAYLAAKRALDLVLAGAGLLFTLPLFLVVMLLIRLETPGAPLIRQTRLGKDGRPFLMFKFRTMRAADADLTEQLQRRNEADGPLFKMRNDPRVTRVGRLLRRTSLDELPQLMNVLLGQMTLVGPRPPLPREMTGGYALQQRLRLRVKPGLTGLWQVSGRSNLPFREMVRLDLEYIERRSLALDLAILVKTVPGVLRGEGAY
jgi:lipopolysaccharide/colanic/teichoic acid biosynthesis glycosyltransferase